MTGDPSSERQRFVNMDRLLTPTSMPNHEIVDVVDDESRVIVVRAWRDSGRVIIRVLAGTHRLDSSRKWVFADVNRACDQIGCVLGELHDGPGSDGKSTGPRQQRRAIRIVDDGDDHRPDD